MKILHTVEFYHPSVGGMQEVVRQLSERLVRHGHEVTVATTRLVERCEQKLNGVRIVDFSVAGNLARGMTGEVEEYREFVTNGDFDVVTNFAAQQWATDALLPILGRVKGVKIFVPTGFSGFYDPLYRNYFASMKGWFGQYDMNVFLSDGYRDVNFARTCGVKNIVLIPNGAAEDEFLAEPDVDIRARLGIPRGNLLILHVGSHSGAKGHAEAIQIFNKSRIRNSTFLMIAKETGGGCARSCRSAERLGRVHPVRRFAGKQLLVRSLSRAETLAAYHAADLMLFPSNVECSPLVLFEAMASRTPFLTTDVGNAAEIIRWSNGGMLLPTAVDSLGWSRTIIPSAIKMFEELCGDGAKRREFAEAGFSAWREQFTWERISLEYEALYRGLVKNGAKGIREGSIQR